MPHRKLDTVCYPWFALRFVRCSLRSSSWTIMMLGSGCRGQNRIELAQRACAMLVTERAQKPVVDASPVEAMRTRQPPDRLPLHKPA
mmetsp:Transcript_1746/g.4944  ORF Transcript_1746/g.4944 Transcript_1746/m.4944 type:complete len:87 (+) Transcript_1746:231-491(+)